MPWTKNCTTIRQGGIKNFSILDMGWILPVDLKIPSPKKYDKISR